MSEKLFVLTLTIGLLMTLSAQASSKDVAVKIASLPEHYHEVDVRNLAFNLDGARIVVESSDQNINVWDWRNHRIDRTILKPGGTGGMPPINPFKFSRDGTQFTTCFPGSVGNIASRIWNTSDWSIAHDIVDEHGGCVAADFSSDGKFYIRLVNRNLAHLDSVVVYDIEKWDLVWGLRLDEFQPTALAANPVDGIIAVSGIEISTLPFEPNDSVKERLKKVISTPTIHIVDLSERKVIQTLHGEANGAMSWSPDGKLLAVTGRLNVEIFEISSGRTLAHAKLEQSTHMNCLFSPDGKYFMEIDQNARGNGLGANLWDNKREKLIQHIAGNFSSVDISHDSQFLALGEKGKTTIWQFK